MTQNISHPPIAALGRRPVSRPVNILAWVLQVAVRLAFLAAGLSKLAGAPQMVAVFEKIGVGQWFRVLTGLLEVVGAVGLLILRTVFYAAVLLTLVMIGAIIAHLTLLGGNPAPAVLLLALAGAIAYLRRR